MRCIVFSLYTLLVFQLLCSIACVVYYVAMNDYDYAPVAQIQVHTEFTQMVIAAIMMPLTFLLIVFVILQHPGVCVSISAINARIGRQSISGPTENCCFSLQMIFQSYVAGMFGWTQVICIGLNIFLIDRLESWVWIIEIILIPLQISSLVLFFTIHEGSPGVTLQTTASEQPIGCFGLVRSIRKTEVFEYSKWVREQGYWSYWMIFIFVLVFITLVYSILQSYGTDGGFYTQSQLNAMNSDIESLDLFKSLPRPAANRLILVMFDGLRYDEVGDPAWESLLTNSVYSQDMNLMLMTSQVPTVSVPNWISLLSGAEPEITGTLGNIEVVSSFLAPPLTDIDTFWSALNTINTFDSAKQTYESFNSVNYFVGSSWFNSLISDQVTPLHYSVDSPNPNSPYLSEINLEISQDQARLSIFLPIVANLSSNLAMVYFNEPDECGHLYGVGTAYTQCAERMAVNFNLILSAVDGSAAVNDTIVIAFSDHGHVSAGGHGGGTSDVRNTPLIVYQKNSAFREIATGQINSLQFAPTIAALLQVPTPRQAQSGWIPILESRITGPLVNISATSQIPESLLALFDLFQQGRQRDQFFFRQCGLSLYTLKQKEETTPTLVMSRGSTNPYGIPLDQQYLAALIADPNNPVLIASTAAELRTDIADNNNLYTNQRDLTWTSFLVRNYIVNIFLVCLPMVIVVNRLIRFSIIGNVCSRAKKSPETTGLISDYDPKMQRWGMVSSIIFIIIYHIVSFATFIICGVVYGYPVMDSSFLHHPSMILPFLCITIIPGSVMVFIFHRATLWRYISPVQIDSALAPNRPAVRGKCVCDTGYDGCAIVGHYFIQFWRFIFMDFCTWSNMVTDWGPIYLIRTYLMVLAFAMCIVILLLEGVFTCVIPGVFTLTFLDATSWDFRYWIISYMMMTQPMTWGATICWLVAPSHSAKPLVGPSNDVILSQLYNDRFTR